MNKLKQVAGAVKAANKLQAPKRKKLQEVAQHLNQRGKDCYRQTFFLPNAE